MKNIILIALAGLLTMPFASAAELTAAQKSAICQTRESCPIGASHDSGKSAQGSALTVVEAHLGLQDKPEDAPDSGCQTADGDADGGAEYWLLDGSAAPQQILKLCNDGYGAAGVGEDEVTIGANRLVHRQYGGSAWRWESTVVFTLSPWGAAAERDCSFHDATPSTGTVTDIDYLAMRARSIAKDSTQDWDDIGCPDWPADSSASFSPTPAQDLLGAYDILTPALGTGSAAAAKIPSGAAIGDCVPAMTTAGTNGFMVFGSPAPEGRAAEIRIVAESLSALLIQIYDPAAEAQLPPAEASWVNLPHVEIWIGLNDESVRTRLPLSDLSQIAVDLNGRLYSGIGRKEAMPSIERWQSRDEKDHPVTLLHLSWAKDYALLDGVAIVYSQAEGGKQARLVSTTGIVKNRPLYLPEVVNLSGGNIDPLPGKCSLRGGLLSKEG